MQLVNDCVIMYDTMKDKKIGIAEVIEKFGVPPEKVIEVQALIGDSTDNVPGVPGIGVKTAAQLIGEYGDLETLLARAGEIKQEKRRQALIENAEKARISKRLVTLDDKVKLDVPLADLAVHEPDYKQLIAFLKAMEFTALTRRVAEFAGLDAGAIEAVEGRRAEHRPSGRRAVGAASPGLPLTGGGMAAKPRAGRDRAGGAGHAAVARRRAARSRAQGEDRPRAIRDRAEHRPPRRLDRARPRRRRRRDQHRDHRRRPDAGARCAASRSRSRRTRPATCRSRIARPATATACSAAGLAPGQMPEDEALAALKPLLEDPGVLKIGQNLKFELQLFAVRGIDAAVARGHDADVLRARRRPLRPHARRARAALLRSHGDRLQRRDRHRQGQGHLRLRRRSRRPRPTSPRTPTSRCGSRRCCGRAWSPSM